MDMRPHNHGDGSLDVSVIMPMRNAGPYVAEAVQSVLNQLCVKLEVVIVDDGSCDDSVVQVQKVADDRVRVVPGPCEGISAAFNAGLQAARGRYVARCDADDIYPPRRLAEQAEWLDERPEHIAVCGSFGAMDVRGKRLQELCGSNTKDITDQLLRGDTVTHFCTWLVRRLAISQTGGCRQYFETAEDIDLQFRLAEVGRVYLQRTIRYWYRLHGESITHRQATARRLFFESAARQFAQQRMADGSDSLMRGTPPLAPAVGEDSLDVRLKVKRMMLGRAWQLRAEGQLLPALREGLGAGVARPWKWGTWRSVVGLVKPPSMRGRD